MKKIIITILVIIVLAVAYYLISPLFITVEVNEEVPDEVVKTEEPVEMEEEPNAVELTGTTGHPVSGTVRVIETDSGRIARYENFETINGPNLHVYLAKDLDAKEYIDLGPVKGTKGNINYEIPDGVDLSEYKYIMYWCVPFSVLFNYADIS